MKPIDPDQVKAQINFFRAAAIQPAPTTTEAKAMSDIEKQLEQLRANHVELCARHRLEVSTEEACDWEKIGEFFVMGCLEFERPDRDEEGPWQVLIKYASLEKLIASIEYYWKIDQPKVAWQLTLMLEIAAETMIKDGMSLGDALVHLGHLEPIPEPELTRTAASK